MKFYYILDQNEYKIILILIEKFDILFSSRNPPWTFIILGIILATCQNRFVEMFSKQCENVQTILPNFSAYEFELNN